jgi:hypothetical protein
MQSCVSELRLVMATCISCVCFWLVLLIATYSGLAVCGQLPVHNDGTLQAPAEWLRFVPEGLATLAFVVMTASVSVGSKLRVGMPATIVSVILSYVFYRFSLTSIVSTIQLKSPVSIPYIDSISGATTYLMQPSILVTHCAEIISSLVLVLLLMKLTVRKQQVAG